MKLGGWHRLWLVLAIAWVAGTGFAYLSSRQSVDEIYHSWANELISYLVANSSDLQGHTPSSIRSLYAEIGDRQLVEALHERYLSEHPAYRYGFAEIDAKYRSDAQSLDGAHASREQLWWLAIVLGVPALAYIGGFSVAWVRAGFRRA